MEDIQYNKGNVIIGAGGLGRELLSFIHHSAKVTDVPHIVGFVDDNIHALDKFDMTLKVIDKLSETDLNKFEGLLLAINNSAVKRGIFERLDTYKIKGFIHHSCIIGERAVLHPSILLFPNVLVSCDVEISKGVFVNCGSQIGHDVFIDEFTNIMANVDIGGNCRIGKNVLIGTGATIFPGIKIPDNTTIGAGSVVFRNIREAGTYMGNPAKKIF